MSSYSDNESGSEVQSGREVEKEDIEVGARRQCIQSLCDDGDNLRQALRTKISIRKSY